MHLKEPFTTFNMSTKKIFDDMYLYLKDVNLQHLESVNMADGVDQLNGMPAETYVEVTSRFWNLIYKDSYHGAQLLEAGRGKA